jgi:hypothetical protein
MPLEGDVLVKCAQRCLPVLVGRILRVRTSGLPGAVAAALKAHGAGARSPTLDTVFERVGAVGAGALPSALIVRARTELGEVAVGTAEVFDEVGNDLWPEVSR